MPYKIRKSGKGYKVFKKNGSKSFSKKALPKKRAVAQLKAIMANTHGEGIRQFDTLVEAILLKY